MSLEFWRLRPEDHQPMLALMLALDFTRDLNGKAELAGKVVPQTLSPAYVRVNNR